MIFEFLLLLSGQGPRVTLPHDCLIGWIETAPYQGAIPCFIVKEALIAEPRMVWVWLSKGIAMSAVSTFNSSRLRLHSLGRTVY